ncbi:protein translocase subunit SecD [Dermatophilaceae bacterium Soc4.6]
MARDPRTKRPRQVLAALVVLLALLVGGSAAAAAWGGGQWTPKLGLDLEGGTEIVLEPVVANGSQVSQGQIDKARDIIENRVNAYGVSEAEVSTLGGRNIVVDIPGVASPATLNAIKKPSQLRFRAVLAEGAGSPQAAAAAASATAAASGTPTPRPSASATPSTSAPAFTPDPPQTSANAAVPEALRAADPTPSTTGTTGTTGATGATSTGGSTATTATPGSSAPVLDQPTDTPTAKPTSASDIAWITPDLAKAFSALDCSKPETASATVDDPAKPLVACSANRQAKYVLGPVEVDGTDISDATSGYQAGPNGQPTTVVEVALTFTGEGTKKFADVTTRLLGLKGAQNQFAIVLDKQVISAPTTQAAITTGRASITGSFTIDSARDLAQQLKFGALPLSFKLQTQDDVSPTLGSEQLRLGLLAGLAGLLLVVVYSLLQYRLLGLVTVASLVVASVITYLALVLLGWSYDFRLTMAGVTGVIVAIGVTADSFIVYFERVRDEVRDGRPLVAAVEAGWARARRTILAADAVNFLAAVVLYLLAASNVRGFAFTLGVTTLIDLVVVILFTHPVVALLARTEFFGGGHRLSGLDPERLGSKVRYVGRGQFSGPGARPASSRPGGVEPATGSVVRGASAEGKA